MAGFTVELHAQGLLNSLSVDVQKQIVGKGLAQTGLYLTGKVKSKLEGHVVTGLTRNSVDWELGRSLVRIGSKRPTLLFLEVGTKPHEIRPSKKKVLSWPGATAKKSAAGLGRGAQGTLKRKGGSKWAGFVSAKVVHHPGTKAEHLLENTLNAEMGNIKTIFQGILVQELKLH